MGKRSLQQKAARAIGNVGTSAKVSSGINKGATLHRGRRKRLEVKERAASKQKFIEEELAKLESIAAKKRETVKKARLVKSIGSALAILPDLAEALPDVDAHGKTSGRVGSDQAHGDSERGRKHGVKHKAWSKIVERESEQLRRVQEHDAVKDLGIEALRMHLSNTVGARADKRPGAGKWKGKVGGRDGGDGRVKKTAKHADRNRKGGDGKAGSVNVERREYKKQMAERAASVTGKRRGEVRKQTMKGLLGGHRGRIGEKREKMV